MKPDEWCAMHVIVLLLILGTLALQCYTLSVINKPIALTAPESCLPACTNNWPELGTNTVLVKSKERL